MTIDVHTHVGLDLGFMLRGWWPYACTAQDLLHLLDENQIDRAVCFPFTLPSAFDPITFADQGRLKLLDGRFPFDRENTHLLDELERIDTKKRLIPFGMFDPARRVKEQLKNLEALVPKIKGLKTQTTTLESPIRKLLDESSDIVAFARQHDLPMLFHTAINPADIWAHVKDCLDVAERYPKVRFNLAHSLRFNKAHLQRAADMPNVWVDCSAHLNHCHLARENAPAAAPKEDRVDADYSKPAQVLEAIHAILKGRYMWGSDNPYMSWCDDTINLIHTYRHEADIFHQLPDDVKISMGTIAPKGWLNMC